MSNRAPILFIDDDADALQRLIRALPLDRSEYECLGASAPEQAMQLFSERKPCVVVLDLALGTEGVEAGFKLLHSIVRGDPSCRVIILTGHGTTEHGLKALSGGAASFLEKPAEPQHVAALIKDGVSQSRLRQRYEELKRSNQRVALGRVIGESSAAQKLREQLHEAALSPQPVLITGETGTGKNLAAHTIHALSARAAKHFVRYQPALDNKDLVNSELFGHAKGAFTGATESRVGLIAEADEGSLFLDEIEALPLETQVALLGVLQDRVFRAVGSSVERRADFRLICASNSDVERDIREGRLRADFFHRVAHVRIHLPPLRERREDIPEISRYVVASLQSRDVGVTDIDEKALQYLVLRAWDGNVRELEAVLERAAYRAAREVRSVITLEDVSTAPASEMSSGQTYHEQVEAFKHSLIQQALSKTGGNQVQAAKLLDLDRVSMRRILARGGRA